MASSETLIAFLLATMVFAYFPGPAVFYTAAQTLGRGRRAGLMATLGLHLGGYVHVIAAAFGLSAILTHVPTAYAALKLAGAFYLIWLGINVIRQGTQSVTETAVTQKSAKRAFVESITVEVLNPKTALFFLAFLPQFADPAAAFPLALQIFILGFIALLAFASADLATVLLAGAITERATKNSRIRQWFGWLGGGILVALGARLAWEARP